MTRASTWTLRVDYWHQQLVDRFSRTVGDDITNDAIHLLLTTTSMLSDTALNNTANTNIGNVAIRKPCHEVMSNKTTSTCHQSMELNNQITSLLSDNANPSIILNSIPTKQRRTLPIDDMDYRCISID
jgi:hypothetical protein